MYSLVPRQGSARGPRGSMIAFRGALRRGVKWPWSVGLPGGIDMTVRDRRFGGGIYNARGRASSRGGASGHPKRACASPGVELNLALKPPQLRLQSMINGWRGRVGRKPPGGRATRGRSFPLKGPATARTAPQIYSGGRTSVGQYYWRKIHVRPVWGGGRRVSADLTGAGSRWRVDCGVSPARGAKITATGSRFPHYAGRVPALAIVGAAACGIPAARPRSDVGALLSWPPPAGGAGGPLPRRGRRGGTRVRTTPVRGGRNARARAGRAQPRPDGRDPRGWWWGRYGRTEPHPQPLRHGHDPVLRLVEASHLKLPFNPRIVTKKTNTESPRLGRGPCAAGRGPSPRPGVPGPPGR